jgi:transposase
MGRNLPRRQLCCSQKGGFAVGKTKRGKGTKWMVLADGEGVPLGVRLESASPSEVTLAEATLDEVRVPRPKGRPRQKPERVIADRGYDSDPLRERLQQQGIELIAPYRSNNKERRYEDGRKLRRYKRRWIVERTNAWLGQSADCWFVMSICSPPTTPSSTSLASGLRSGGIFETRSRRNS